MFHTMYCLGMLSLWLLVCTVAKVDIKGVTASIDTDLLNWMEYQPSTSPRKRHRTTEKRMSRIFSRSFSASTPKRKSYARSRCILSNFFFGFD